MKSVKTTKTGKNFTAVSVGKLSEVKDYLLQLGEMQIPGKVFVGQALGTTGSELSFQTFAPGQDGGFLQRTRITRNSTLSFEVKVCIR